VYVHVRAQARAKPAPSPRRGGLRTLEVLRARDQGVVYKQLPPAQRLVGAADGMPWRDARLGQLRVQRLAQREEVGADDGVGGVAHRPAALAGCVSSACVRACV
jgi:hypothetical protein